MQIQTTFVSHEPKQVNGRNGTFTIHKFKAADGNVFDTTKTDVANAAYALLNTPILVDYTEIPKVSGDRTFINRELVSVVAFSGQAVAPAPGVALAAPTGASPPLPTAYFSSPIAVAPTVPPPDEVGPRISRSVAQEHGLKAIELALKAGELGITSIENIDQLPEVANRISKLSLLIAVLAAGYIYQGTQGNDAPVQAEASAPASDDGIPF